VEYMEMRETDKNAVEKPEEKRQREKKLEVNAKLIHLLLTYVLNN
jgi:hypothetical protein